VCPNINQILLIGVYPYVLYVISKPWRQFRVGSRLLLYTALVIVKINELERIIFGTAPLQLRSGSNVFAPAPLRAPFRAPNKKVSTKINNFYNNNSKNDINFVWIFFVRLCIQMLNKFKKNSNNLNKNSNIWMDFKIFIQTNRN
jgi:hypothetical protein